MHSSHRTPTRLPWLGCGGIKVLVRLQDEVRISLFSGGWLGPCAREALSQMNEAKILGRPAQHCRAPLAALQIGGALQPRFVGSAARVAVSAG